jgi:hypothetical protein
MSLLIYSGLLYLVGISIILALKPSLMFSKDGNWKEFGIGRSRERYTWMPFWLFAILWAMISYMIVLVIVGNMNTNTINTVTNTGVSNVSKRKSMNMDDHVEIISDKINKGDLKKGYYVLNMNNTMKKGSPQYVYLGPEAPDLRYQEEF